MELPPQVSRAHAFSTSFMSISGRSSYGKLESDDKYLPAKVVGLGEGDTVESIPETTNLPGWNSLFLAPRNTKRCTLDDDCSLVVVL